MAFCLLVSLSSSALAQLVYYRVTFVDKGPDLFVPGSAAYEETLLTYHERALQRRAASGMDTLLRYEDQPVYRPYLAPILDMDVYDPVIINWRNCVVLMTDTITASRIQTLDYVDTVVPTGQMGYAIQAMDCEPARPGSSSSNHEALNSMPLIDAGVSGKGALVAIIDNGFRIANMSSLQHVDVQETYDVIYNDSIVSNESGDPPDQDGHGSLVLSVAAGWHQDSIIGIAPFASYLLIKSEDMRYERRVEEDFYCAAIEWAERRGADIISTSLGYFAFDSIDQQTDYSWLDGKSTFAARAVNRAASLGVLCVIASGNSGPDDSTLNTPADADSAITVGASLWPAPFAWPSTSTGPTADGRVKPDLAAVGANVRAQSLDGTYISASGTSMSAPQIAALTALMRQLYPDIPGWSIRQALFDACSLRGPDDLGQLGRGVPDAVKAARRLGTFFGPGIGPPSVVEANGQQHIYCAIFSEEYPLLTLQIKDQVETLRAEVFDSLWYGVDLTSDLFNGDTLYGRFIAKLNNVERYYPTDSTWFPIPRRGHRIPCGVRLPTSIVNVEEQHEHTEIIKSQPAPRLYPNPIAGGITTVFIEGIRDVHTIRIASTSAGSLEMAEWTRAIDGRIAVHVPTQPAGHFLIIVQATDRRIVLPFIRY